jgi:hypothetical protein
MMVAALLRLQIIVASTSKIGGLNSDFIAERIAVNDKVSRPSSGPSSLSKSR